MPDWVLPKIDRKLCTGCGLCVKYCPTDAAKMVDCLPKVIKPQSCSYCGLCEDVCPVGAIRLEYVITYKPDSK